MDDFEHTTSGDELNVEITSLDPHRERHSSLLQWRMVRSPRFWRLATAGGFLLLAIGVILSGFPLVREQAWQILPPAFGGRLPSNTAYIGSYADEIYALRSDGLVQWHLRMNGNIISSPTVSGGVAYVGTSKGDIDALRTDDGTLLWHYRTDGFVYSLVARGGVIYVLDALPDDIYALRASTGFPIWHNQTYEPLSQALVIANGVVYGATAPLPAAGEGPPGTIYAWRTRDGTSLWHYEISSSYLPLQIVVAGGRVYVSSGAETGHLFVLRASNGTLLWQYQASSFASTAVMPDGNVYVALWEGMVGALAARDGTMLWHYPIGTFQFILMAEGPVAIYVIGLDMGLSNSVVYGLQPGTGSLLWHYQARAPVFSEEEISRIIYLASLDGTISALRASDGILLWHQKLEAAVFQENLSDVSPFLQESQGALYVRSQDASGTIYALRASDGALLWHYSPGIASR